MPITDDNYHAFCSNINIGVCECLSVFACAWSELLWAGGEHGVSDLYVSVSVVEDDDEFINSYSFCIHHCLLLHTHAHSLSLASNSAVPVGLLCMRLHFLLLFINFWSIHGCLSVRCCLPLRSLTLFTLRTTILYLLSFWNVLLHHPVLPFHECVSTHEV